MKGATPEDFVTINALSMADSYERLFDMWYELKTWLKKHPNQIHYMGAATIESVVKKMEELEKS